MSMAQRRAAAEERRTHVTVAMNCEEESGRCVMYCDQADVIADRYRVAAKLQIEGGWFQEQPLPLWVLVRAERYRRIVQQLLMMEYQEINSNTAGCEDRLRMVVGVPIDVAHRNEALLPHCSLRISRGL